MQTSGGGGPSFTLPALPMPDIPNRLLKILFLAHFVLTVWAGQDNWMPNAYLFYNGIYLLLIVWSIHVKESEEPVMMALAVNVASILIDLIIIPTYYTLYPLGSSHARFSLAMAILVLISRPVTSFLLYNHMTERINQFGTYGGAGAPGFFAAGSGNRARGTYEDIDSRQQVPPALGADLGSPSRGGFSPNLPYNSQS